VGEMTASSAAAAPAFAAALAAHAAGGAQHVVGGDGIVARVVLKPVAGRAVLDLRAVPAPSCDTFATVLGFRLPMAAQSSAADAQGRVHALWAGPGHWLIACPESERPVLEAGLCATLEGLSGALTDVSHGYAVLNVSGGSALDMLAQGCGIDLDPPVFIEGACALTALARMQVAIHRLPRGGGLDLYVARSLAGSLWQFVTRAGLEFGYRVGDEAGVNT
jgi:sarcosine oxidase subunit gamma